MYGGMNGMMFDVNRLRDGGRQRGDDDCHGGVNLLMGFYILFADLIWFGSILLSQEQVFLGLFFSFIIDRLSGFH